MMPALRVNFDNNEIPVPGCPEEKTISGPRFYLMSLFGGVEAALIYVIPAYMFKEMCIKF